MVLLMQMGFHPLFLYPFLPFFDPFLPFFDHQHFQPIYRSGHLDGCKVAGWWWCWCKWCNWPTPAACRLLSSAPGAPGAPTPPPTKTISHSFPLINHSHENPQDKHCLTRVLLDPPKTTPSSPDTHIPLQCTVSQEQD